MLTGRGPIPSTFASREGGPAPKGTGPPFVVRYTKCLLSGLDGSGGNLGVGSGLGGSLGGVGSGLLLVLSSALSLGGSLSLGSGLLGSGSLGGLLGLGLLGGLSLGKLGSSGATELVGKALDASAGVNELLGAGVERVALVAEVDACLASCWDSFFRALVSDQGGQRASRPMLQDSYRDSQALQV